VAIDDCTRLSNIISELRQYAHVLVEDRMTIVSVVGNMQWEYAGFEAKIMEALKDIPLRMISYGSSIMMWHSSLRIQTKKGLYKP